VGADVEHGSDHDSHRDQRCGTDDFHGRSSPGGSGSEPEPASRLHLGATERPCETHETDAEHGATCALFRRRPAGGVYVGMGGAVARVRLPSTLKSRIQYLQDLLVF
jgi:hypothetical protein